MKRKKGIPLLLLIISLMIGAVGVVDAESSFASDYYDHANQYYDGEYDRECYYCGNDYGWTLYEDYDDNGCWKKFNSKYHKVLMECDWCGELQWILEKHEYDSAKVKKYATPKSKGKLVYRCDYCDQTKTKTVKWKLHGKGCKNYDPVKHSTVYVSSTKVRVKLRNALKGSVVRVKIGKRIYSKKIKSSRVKKVTIRIRRPKMGQKVRINVKYRGKKIGTYSYDSDDMVWYGNKVRDGMTKKQVRCTWGSPSDTSSGSGGWSYWYWSDGSCVYFKNGRVYYWYDAAG